MFKITMCALILGVISGCGGSSSPQSAAPSALNQNAAATPAPSASAPLGAFQALDTPTATVFYRSGDSEAFYIEKNKQLKIEIGFQSANLGMLPDGATLQSRCESARSTAVAVDAEFERSGHHERFDEIFAYLDLDAGSVSAKRTSPFSSVDLLNAL